MLTVKTPEDASATIRSIYQDKRTGIVRIETQSALGRILGADVIADEYVPGFDRSTVDGYAVIASDTFGCSASIPAVLELEGEILMGEAAHGSLKPLTCIAVSTGGDLPEGADAVVMVEHVEVYGDGLIGILRPVAPGNNIIFKGDDVSPGDLILKAGTVLDAYDIGLLSALGKTEVCVMHKPVVGIISTGDELVDSAQTPGRGQIRDVNTPMLMAAILKCGAQPRNYGIVRDEAQALSQAVTCAVTECDVVLISGGSSAGVRDMTAKIIQTHGTLIFHGIAMKPGKPTIFGSIHEIPVFGLPGHPVAAYFVTELFVRPLIAGLMGADVRRNTAFFAIGEAISANHGRAEYVAVRVGQAGVAVPLKGKSGLISSLAYSDGYICIPRDREGVSKGAMVEVIYW
ncbi:MAG: molybdopterin molybdotransferase MoeA [Oscillospiraceae bacterium]|nr:molybdopterin molybdotransferase MoeA [Oscillospiraceae bacterium]